jgi:hypothetical protein
VSKKAAEFDVKVTEHHELATQHHRSITKQENTRRQLIMRISLAVTTNTPSCMPQKPPKLISSITGSRVLRAPSSSSLGRMLPSVAWAVGLAK